MLERLKDKNVVMVCKTNSSIFKYCSWKFSRKKEKLKTSKVVVRKDDDLGTIEDNKNSLNLCVWYQVGSGAVWGRWEGEKEASFALYIRLTVLLTNLTIILPNFPAVSDTCFLYFDQVYRNYFTPRGGNKASEVGWEKDTVTRTETW